MLEFLNKDWKLARIAEWFRNEAGQHEFAMQFELAKILESGFMSLPYVLIRLGYHEKEKHTWGQLQR